MAEIENGPTAETPPQIKMQVLGQFIRDMSFENIVAQKGVQGDVTPDIQVQVSLDGKKRPTDNQYEVVAKFKVTSKNKGTEDMLFLMELDYGGIFHIENVPEEQLHPYLMIECPRILFPYIRRIVSDVTRDGGFPQLNLENIDFVSLYRQTMLQRQAAQSSAEEQQPS
ncbi:MAG: protein-export chaperone SecB [Rhodobacteraceae bacterium]|nr:protein-export chaperone SecB [Paracoccaceae bacterium]